MNDNLELTEPEGSYSATATSLHSRMKVQAGQVPCLSTESVALVLTTAGLTISPVEDDEVIVFAENAFSHLRLSARESDDGPTLVAFLVPRATAERIVVSENSIHDIASPPLHRLVSVATINGGSDDGEDCLAYLQLLSSYRPASYLQQGFAIGPRGFSFVSFGLDERKISPEIAWDHPSCLSELCACVRLIRDEAMRPLKPAVPMLMDVIPMESRSIGLYSAQIGGQQFRLLPLLSRGEGRKAFVALGVSDNGQRVRAFKYSWYRTGDEWRELRLLQKLRDVPGVVHLDDELTETSLESNSRNETPHEENSRTRGLLALRTIGFPLCACESVLEFLEAMYDLLEVLRFLVQEKGILHRDVSWSNVLIHPVETGSGSRRLREEAKRLWKDKGTAIPHTYRFISDIFEEDEWKIRVALTDFDHASEVQTGQEVELRDKAGTQMFMADDVLSVRTTRSMNAPSLISEMVENKALDAVDGKYADPGEKENWDDFYRRFADLQWRITPRFGNDEMLEESFRHGAVHDAESVLYLCLLFFNRMWPLNERIDRSELDALEIDRGKLFGVLAGRTCSENTQRLDRLYRRYFGTGDRFVPFYEMLTVMHTYVSVPWYNVANTGRGESHEFHLHDFMQRLLLREIQKLRGSGEPVLIEESPLPVKTSLFSPAYGCDAYPNFTFTYLKDDEARVKRKKRRGPSYSSIGRGRSVRQGHQPAVPKRLRKGKENSTKYLCRAKKGPATASKSTNVLPVDRPSEMPKHCKRRFSRYTSLFWELFWWKAREKLWITAK